jgi:hypothetical protein
MKYKANYNANNGTRMMQDIESNNKRELISSIRRIAEGNRYANNECRWTVHETESGKCVAAGGMWSNGKRYRIN